MNPIMHEILVEFAAAHRAAEPNSGIMVGNPTTEEVDGCAERMVRVSRADARLMTLSTRPDDLPEPLREFFAAEADKGCMRCWASSVRFRNHPECNQKIDRWFATHRALVDYAGTL